MCFRVSRKPFDHFKFCRIFLENWLEERIALIFFFYNFVFTWTRARAHCSWRCRRCCEQVKGRREKTQPFAEAAASCSHFDTEKNQFPSSSVRAFKHAASWQRPVGRFNPSRRPPTSDLTHAVVKRSIAAWFSINSGRICPSKKERKKEIIIKKSEWAGGGAELLTTSCQMSRFKRSLFADRFLVHLLSTRCTSVALLLIGVAALNHTVSRWIWQWTVGPESRDGRSQLSPPSLPPSHPPCFFSPPSLTCSHDAEEE